jgi:hypothetical protein
MSTALPRLGVISIGARSSSTCSIKGNSARGCRSVALPVQSVAHGSPTRRRIMNTYVILRRSGWRSPEDLQAAAARSTKVGDEEMSEDIRWIRSYVLEENGGSVGTVCVYQASSPEAIREHASRADLPVDEIIPVADTVLVRPDPGT